MCCFHESFILSLLIKAHWAVDVLVSGLNGQVSLQTFNSQRHLRKNSTCSNALKKYGSFFKNQYDNVKRRVFCPTWDDYFASNQWFIVCDFLSRTLQDEYTASFSSFLLREYCRTWFFFWAIRCRLLGLLISPVDPWPGLSRVLTSRLFILERLGDRFGAAMLFSVFILLRVTLAVKVCQRTKFTKWHLADNEWRSTRTYSQSHIHFCNIFLM